MIEIIDCEQQSPEWFEAHNGIASASVFKILLSSGRTKGSESILRAQLVAKKAGETITGKPDPSGYKNADMQRGNEMEAEARVQYEFLNPYFKLVPVGFIRNSKAGCSPARLSRKSRSAAPASGPTSARATAARRAGAFARYSCGGAPTGCRGRAPCCRSVRSAGTTPGAKTPATGAITARSGARPMKTVTGCVATITSTTSLSRSTITLGRASPAAAARSSSIWRGRNSRRRRAASRCACATCRFCCTG